MSDTLERTLAGSITLDEAMQFIWREAELLDAQDYAEWLDLWTEEGLYIIPINRDEGDTIDQLNVAYDDAEMRRSRTKRLKSGFSMSSAPSARTVRLVSRFVPQANDDGSLTVRAAQQVTEYKFERTRILAADMTYRLVRDGEGLRLDHKEIRLLNSDEALWGIGYLL